MQYYKNYQVIYKVKRLEGNLVEIHEKTSLTLVRPDAKRFIWRCRFAYGTNDEKSIGASLECLKIDGNLKEEGQKGVKFSRESINDTNEKLEVKCYLEGRKEYRIDREVKIIQDVSNDREYSFSSEKIIDDISVRVEHSDDVNVYFSECNGNKFFDNNVKGRENISKINRAMFLPGEKYKLFIY